MTYYIGTMPVTPYLEHFGILGMKWGVRRYQNPDGTLTEAGKVRYSKYSELDKGQRKESDRIIKTGQEGYSAASDAARTAGGIAQRWSKKSTKNSPAKTMTDEDLRKAVNRMNLEQQYNRLTGEDTRAGAVFTSDVMYTIGEAIHVAADIAFVIAVYRKLR